MQGIDNLNTERAGLLTQEEAKLCLSFGVCTTKCEFDAIHLFRERPECTDYQKSEDKLKLGEAGDPDQEKGESGEGSGKKGVMI